MIQSKDLEILHRSIQVYNSIANQIYLIGFRCNKNHPLKFAEIETSEKHFWHLLGVTFDRSLELTGAAKREVYERCLHSLDVSAYLEYTHRAIDVGNKFSVFMQIYDFVANAGQLVLASTKSTPEETTFKIGAGRVIGYIGYGEDKSGAPLFPKTVRNRSIFSLDPKANDKVVIILSKGLSDAQYREIRYIQSRKLLPSIYREIPDRYHVSVA